MKMMKAFGFTVALILGAAASLSHADKVYTTHTGGSGNISDGTTATNAVTLTTALAIANADPARRHIVLLGGAYNGLPRLEITANDVMLDGGYEDVGGVWRKSYEPSVLNIVSSDEAYSSSIAHRRGIVAANRTGLLLQDLTINLSGPTGTSGSGEGKSAYGIYLDGCSNYAVRRVGISTGNATSGNVGRYGLSGNTGNTGSSGGAGSNASGAANGGNGGYGGLGGVGSKYWSGGGAADASAWGEDGQFGGCGGEGARDDVGQTSWHGNRGGANRTNDRAGPGSGSGGTYGLGGKGEDGGNGGNGGVGSSGGTGSSGSAGVATYSSGFFVPGNGSHGSGGAAGKGGRRWWRRLAQRWAFGGR
ncbi:hypothetical protein PDESU_04500 [Pontiella desulfatans]|uniref:DUF1565 domain-containing protein n=1 Tax=Pontiella desulfatans TaxID=2750659 RepID=A0A6C2U8T5_PONDE|nr:hypothetical protein [Pontiella desulfatans]VGO15911.1 hypothetical protein PDESU_04500 [Pontiella desulfatans]